MSLEISLEDITVSRGGAPILDGVNWHLPPGGRVALLGGNGAGKSTLMRVARGEIWPDQLPGGGFAGRRIYRLDGEASPSPIDARQRIGLAGADLRDLYRRRGWNVAAWLVVVSGLTDSPLPSGLVDPTAQAAAMDALERLHMGRLAYRPFLELSQGQAMAVLLARAVVRRSEWVFLDEAADGLDGPARRRLHALLERLAGDGVGLAAASHHPKNLPGLDFSALVLDHGRVMFSGGLDAAASRLFLKTPATGVRPRREAGPRCEADGSGLETDGLRLEGYGPPLLELSAVSVALGGPDVLEDITWTLSAGQHWAVLGRNGAGKSSLVRLLAGELHPHAGRITRFGLPEPASLWDLRARMGLVAWDAQADYPGECTVSDVLLSGFFGSFGLYDEPLDHMRDQVAGWLERLGLAGLAGRPLSSLSHGQARRAMIGRALVHDPAVLLLDEPLGGLDPQARADVLGLLDDLAVQGLQLVMITHNPMELPAAITHGLILEQGRAVASGSIEDILQRYAA